MAKKGWRDDPMHRASKAVPDRVHISVLTFRNREDLAKLPKNVTVGLAVPEDLPIEEWSRKAKKEMAEVQAKIAEEMGTDDPNGTS